MPEQFNGYEPSERSKKRESPERLRKWLGLLVDLFCRDFVVEGKNGVEQELQENPKAKFVLATSHFSNLDVSAAVEALGDILDIQVTAESGHFASLAAQNFLFKIAGQGSFTPLSYRVGKKDKHYGVFDPDDFIDVAQKIEEGKTPWMAIHPFTKDGAMQKARIGAVYLAHKTGAMIIPAALDYQGGSVSLEGGVELVKAFKKRKKGKGTYHVGKPIKLLPLDVSIVGLVMDKRALGLPVSNEERQLFSLVLKRLRQDADTIANKIGSMLPPERRGQYQEIPEIELTEGDLQTLMVP